MSYYTDKPLRNGLLTAGLLAAAVTLPAWAASEGDNSTDMPMTKAQQSELKENMKNKAKDKMNSMSGNTMSGNSMSTNSMTESRSQKSMAGNSMSGNSMSGNAMSNNVMSGNSMSGNSMSDQ